MATGFYPMAQWPSTQMVEPPLMTQEELDQQSFLAAGFPIPQNEFEPWCPQLDQMNMNQMDWYGEMAYKQRAPLRPYPQSWYEAGLVNNERKQLDASWSGFIPEYPTCTPIQPPSDELDSQLFSQTATERALFMTPPATQYYPTFPGSPISSSEFCGTPEMSRESDHEERERYSTSSRSPYTLATPDTRPKNEVHGGYFSHNNMEVEGVFDEFDESENILEMPDGTTRRTTNWLPVDSSAGFTIESTPIDVQYRDPSHTEELRDIQGAFFVSPAR